MKERPYLVVGFGKGVTGSKEVFLILQCERTLLPYRTLWPPEGRPGMSDVFPLSGISGLSFDSTLLSLVLFFGLVLVLFESYLFSDCWPILLTFSRKMFSICH